MHFKPVKYNLKTHSRHRDIRRRLDMMSVSRSSGMTTFIDNKGEHYVSTDKFKKKKRKEKCCHHKNTDLEILFNKINVDIL